jgi:drug/metabolite transporter (DMT)-like permease
VFAAATLWSLGGLGIKACDASPLAVAGWRSAFALPVLTIAVGRGFAAEGPRLVRRWPLLGAAVAYMLTVTTFVVATKATTAANAIVLQYTGPAWVAALSWPMLRERVGARDAVALVLAVLGMIVLVSGELRADAAWGIGVALFSGVSFGAIPLFLRLEERLSHGATHLARAPAFAFLVGSVLTVLVCAPAMATGSPTTPKGWAVLVGLGVVQIGLAYTLYGAGVRRLRAVEASLVTMVEPLLNPLWVALGTGEVPGVAALIGGAAILSGVGVQATGRARSTPKAPPIV